MRRPSAAILLAGALVLAACGNGEDGAAEDPTAPSPPATETAPPTEDAPPTEEPTASAEPTALPGEVVEIHPYEGDGLGVIGVEADDVLHVREGPGTGFDSIAQLDPLTTDVTATGQNRQLEDGSFWSQIEVDGAGGWASTSFLAYVGQTTDITADLADLPSAPTLEEAAGLVAQQRASDGPPSTTVVVVDGPREGDLGEIVLDVTGFGDDAIAGERLHVFAVEEGEAFTVRTVEARVLCARGVSDGLCL